VSLDRLRGRANEVGPATDIPLVGQDFDLVVCRFAADDCVGGTSRLNKEEQESQSRNGHKTPRAAPRDGASWEIKKDFNHQGHDPNDWP
jgi:hypothetical protein